MHLVRCRCASQVESKDKQFGRQTTKSFRSVSECRISGPLGGPARCVESTVTGRPKLAPDRMSPGTPPPTKFQGLWYINWFRFVLLFSSIIPVSLRVNLTHDLACSWVRGHPDPPSRWDIYTINTISPPH